MVAIKSSEKTRDIFFRNFIGGVAWAAGASVGFGVLAMFLGILVNNLGGLPVIGGFLASLVEATQLALKSRY